VSGKRDDSERLIDPATIRGRDRYALLTSLVVPRPIGWVSTRSEGISNLAPFSYFAALAPTPMLIGISIGARGGEEKDTLRNIRRTGAFCVNVVSEPFLEAMNASSGDHAPNVDEFAIAGLSAADAATVDAPYVAGCPAVMECALFREVPLGEAPTVLVIGEVRAVRLAGEVVPPEGSFSVDPAALRPVARLGGEWYAKLGELVALPRPRLQ
jgi:flavin reductase (DIM6/NTAB) family NADH-FMN oxidoreductase RutF